MGANASQGKKGLGCFRVFLIILAIPIIIIGGFIFFGTSDLRRSDEEVLKTYQPTPEIADIAEKNILTGKGKAAFYRTNPEIVDAEIFRKYCKVNGIEALACVGPKRGGGPFGGRQIHLLKIDDPGFSDHKYAAAMHEMLHAEYDRLSSSAKTRVNSLLEQEFSTKHKDNYHLLYTKSTLEKANAEKRSKQTFLEELHSKFGVEYNDLLPELEEYYKQYFADRTKVVALYKNGGFNSRARRIDEIRYELNLLAPRLTSMESQLTAYQNAGDQEGFNSLIGQYNSTVAQYNAMVAESQRLYGEVEQFYTYFNPDYKPPEERK